MSPDLFDNAENRHDLPPKPLAERMRPTSFEEFIGQEGIVSEGKPLRLLIESGKISSMIFWGPPGTGKTTLARLIAGVKGFAFTEVSAVTSGVKELREAIEQARLAWKINGSRTILFIDEVHRFSKVQQDAILPHVEKGEIVVIGSTTENPAFEVIPALRSRCGIYRLSPLSYDAVVAIVKKALSDSEKGLGEQDIKISDAALERVASQSGGDARVALNLLEAATHAAGVEKIEAKLIDDLAKDSSIMYDKLGQEHFDHASAFQKSLRGSDPDAAIYWLAKMLEGGEDPRFIARRLIVTASEDVGLADPAALMIAIAAAEAIDRIGLPEGRIPLAHATLHIATAPKSNSAYMAIDKAVKAVKSGESYSPPNHLKDTHYKDAKQFGFGEGYKYPHGYPDHYVEQEYLPEELAGRKYYEPSDQGREANIKERMGKLKKGKK